MRAIHLAQLDKVRPVLILTRETALSRMAWLSVAPITSTAKGLAVEVPVGPANGLHQACVINCDNIVTIPSDDLGRYLGQLMPDQEALLATAIIAAYDLEAR